MLAPPEFDFSPPFTIDLDRITPEQAPMVGKKAFRLARAGQDLFLPIPAGFAITTNAFHYFMEYNDLQKPVDSILADIDLNDSHSLEKQSEALQALILDADMPEPVEEAVLAELASLRGKHSPGH